MIVKKGFIVISNLVNRIDKIDIIKMIKIIENPHGFSLKMMKDLISIEKSTIPRNINFRNKKNKKRMN